MGSGVQTNLGRVACFTCYAGATRARNIGLMDVDKLFAVVVIVIVVVVGTCGAVLQSAKHVVGPWNQ